MARLAAPKQPAPTHEYVVIDTRVKPDLHRSLGGVKMIERNGRWFVRMNDAQAAWYLLQGTIVPIGSVQPASARAAARAPIPAPAAHNPPARSAAPAKGTVEIITVQKDNPAT